MTSTPPPRRVLRTKKPTEYNRDPLAAAVNASQKHDEIPLTPVKKRHLPIVTKENPSFKPLPAWGVDGAEAFEFKGKPRKVLLPPLPRVYNGPKNGGRVKPELWRKLPNELKDRIMGYVFVFDDPVSLRIQLNYDHFSKTTPWTYRLPANNIYKCCAKKCWPRIDNAPSIVNTHYPTMDYTTDALCINYTRCDRGMKAKNDINTAFQNVIHQIHADPVACEKLREIQVSYCPRLITADAILGLLMIRYDPNDMSRKIEMSESDDENGLLRGLKKITFCVHKHVYNKRSNNGARSAENESRLLLKAAEEFDNRTYAPIEMSHLDGIGREVLTEEEKEEAAEEREEDEKWRLSAMGSQHYQRRLSF